MPAGQAALVGVAIFIVSVIAFLLLLRWRSGAHESDGPGWRDVIKVGGLIALWSVFMVQKAMVDGMSLAFAVLFTLGYLAFLALLALVAVGRDKRRRAHDASASNGSMTP